MSFDPNNWGDFLSTPPNLAGSPPLLSNAFNSNLQPLPTTTTTIETQQNENNSQNLSINEPIISHIPHPEIGEIEHRNILILGANPFTTIEDIKNVFGNKTSINNIDISGITDGWFTIDFFDLRHAISMKNLHNGQLFKDYTIEVHYATLPPIYDIKKPPNNGTIVIFHLPPHVNNDYIFTIFSQYGEIKQIRGTPSKTSQRFVEFWDIRSSENALNSMNGKFLMGARVSIEFSLPGGFRRNIQKVESAIQSPVIQKKLPLI